MLFVPLPATLALALVAGAAGKSADWPQFRGPQRDGLSEATGLLQTWPKKGPPLLWQATGLGGGYSSISIAGDRIYTLGNRGNTTYLVALARSGGKVLWSSPVGPAGGNLGCTPTVDGDRVYALGQAGDLVCVSTAGKRLWHHNLKKEFGGSDGGWHYCESPLVDGDRVVVTPGGKDATLMAFAKGSGEVLWKCPVPVRHNQAGYSSVVVAEVGGVRHYVQLINGGVVGVGEDGRFLWKYERLGPNTANIPTPIVFGDHVLACAGYGKGGALLRLRAAGKDVAAEEVYFNKRLTNKHGGVVRVGDHLYGDTDDQGRPFCADVKTGKVLWQRERGQGQGQGSASVTYADGRLYFHYDNGVVALVEDSADGYHETGSFLVPKPGRPAWAHPVVCDGRLYLREGDLLFCYDVRARR